MARIIFSDRSLFFYRKNSIVFSPFDSIRFLIDESIDFLIMAWKTLWFKRNTKISILLTLLFWVQLYAVLYRDRFRKIRKTGGGGNMFGGKCKHLGTLRCYSRILWGFLNFKFVTRNGKGSCNPDKTTHSKVASGNDGRLGKLNELKAFISEVANTKQ